jgi:hypothetical protein
MGSGTSFWGQGQAGIQEVIDLAVLGRRNLCQRNEERPEQYVDIIADLQRA